jgi:gluconate 2-dehydrogenase gamma chain
MTTEEQEHAGRLFFDTHQWETIEAAMARIIPTDHDPGAREARTVRFLDRYLSGLDYIYARPDGSGFMRLEGRVAEAWRQRIDGLRRKYVAGIADMDRRSSDLFGAPFCQLSPAQQDQVLREMEKPVQQDEKALQESQVVSGFEQPEPAMQQSASEHSLDFFPLLVLHTRQGFYADPIYGGNQDHVGWKVVGFPGPSSLAEVHRGRFRTDPYFAQSATGLTEGNNYEA